MDMATIGGALTSLKALRELLQAAASLKIDNEVLVRINDALNQVGSIQETLFETREQLFELQKQNEELRQQIKTYDNFTTRKAQYRLWQAPAGGLIYEFLGEPKHFMCPRCVESSKEIHPLQGSGNPSYCFNCRNCKSNYVVYPEPDAGHHSDD